MCIDCCRISPIWSRTFCHLPTPATCLWIIQVRDFVYKCVLSLTLNLQMNQNVGQHTQMTRTTFFLRKIFFVQFSLVIVNVHDEFNKENHEWLRRLRWNFCHNWALLGGLGQGFWILWQTYMIEEIYTYLTKQIIVVTFLVSDLPSRYINIELLGELSSYWWSRFNSGLITDHLPGTVHHSWTIHTMKNPSFGLNNHHHN